MLEVRPESAGKILWLRADALTKLLAHFMTGAGRTFLREHLAEARIWIRE